MTKSWIGILNGKYPGGVESQKNLLQKEGHKIISKGKNLVVDGYEKVLVKL